MKRNYSTKILLDRLEKYDQKYYDAITKPSNLNYGYSMRAYHAIKVSNPPEWKIKAKAELIAFELKNRGIQFNTRYLNLYNYNNITTN
ncbi:TPA: hypothetical protein ACGZ9U_003716 [Elizabethkingia anophelis]